MRDLSNEEESMKEQDAYSRHMEDLEERQREEKHEQERCYNHGLFYITGKDGIRCCGYCGEPLDNN